MSDMPQPVEGIELDALFGRALIGGSLLGLSANAWKGLGPLGSVLAQMEIGSAALKIGDAVLSGPKRRDFGPGMGI